MYEVIYYILFFLTFISAACSIFYSIRSRRTPDPQKKGLLAAKLNISMGSMLLTIALIQLIAMDSWVRIVVGVVFLLLGLFNAFAGLRNYRFFAQQHKEG